MTIPLHSKTMTMFATFRDFEEKVCVWWLLPLPRPPSPSHPQVPADGHQSSAWGSPTAHDLSQVLLCRLGFRGPSSNTASPTGRLGKGRASLSTPRGSGELLVGVNGQHWTQCSWHDRTTGLLDPVMTWGWRSGRGATAMVRSPPQPPVSTPLALGPGTLIGHWPPWAFSSRWAQWFSVMRVRGNHPWRLSAPLSRADLRPIQKCLGGRAAVCFWTILQVTPQRELG